MSRQDEIEQFIAEHRYALGGACSCGWNIRPLNERWDPDWRSVYEQWNSHVAEELLGSTVFNEIIRESKEVGWAIGYLRGVMDEAQDLHPADNPFTLEEDNK